MTLSARNKNDRIKNHITKTTSVRLTDSSSSSKSTAEIYKGQSASGRPLLGHFRYEVLETIGQGGQGKVKKARLKLQNGFKMTAIKFVFKNKLHSGSATRLKHEIDFLLKLRHPNIIQLHECYHSWPYREHDGGWTRWLMSICLSFARPITFLCLSCNAGSIVDSVALVQELCSGELMNILVLYKKFTPALALNYFRQLTAGLGACLVDWETNLHLGHRQPNPKPNPNSKP